MDPKERGRILEQLYGDYAFASLQHPRDQFKHILSEYLHWPTDGNDREWFRQLLTTVDSRLNEWNNTHNRKSYKLAKKLRNSARKVLELSNMFKTSELVEGSIATEYLDGEQRDILKQAEKYYSKAIVTSPYVSAEYIDRNMDKVARLKVSLYQERAEVRYRAGKYNQAIVDVSMAMHHADQIAEQFKGTEDLKMIAVKCFAQLKLIEPNKADDVLDYVTNAHSTLDSDGDENAEQEIDSDQKARHQARDSLNDMIEFHGYVSNYNADSAPQLDDKQREEGYFRYQFAEDKIEIQCTSMKGRHFVAREHIEAGTVILVEKPYSMVVNKDFLTKKCNLCLKDLTDSDEQGYPCDYCKEVRFCCLNCFEEAYYTYHRYECGFLGLLLANNYISQVHVFRILSQIGVHTAIEHQRKEKASSSSVLEDFLTKRDLRTKTVFELTDEDRFSLYQMSSNLAEHSAKYDASMNAYHAMQALDIALVLLAKDEKTLNSNIASESVQELLLDLLCLCLVNIRRVTVNVFGQFVTDSNGTKHASTTSEIMVGSMINHSCVPNVTWQFDTGHIVFKANRAIPQNQEISITYGQTRVIPFQQRQDALQHYHFLCSCTLCRADIASLPVVVRCQHCQNGPLVVARKNAGCLNCYATTSASQVKKAIAEIQKNRQLLQLCHKMVLASSIDGQKLQLSKSASCNLKQSTLSVTDQIEACLRGIAYYGTTGFTASLRELADIYQHLGELDRALELCKLYEESESQIEAAQENEVRQNGIAKQEKMVELNFWTEICCMYFGRLMTSGRDIEDDRALQVTILIYVRFLKQALSYLTERIGLAQLHGLTVTELLDQAQFNDAKLAFILSERKKAFLISILDYSKSRCN